METFRALRRMFTGGAELESSASGGLRPAEPSAAQNGTVMIQTCKQCGAAHGAEATNCYVCRSLLSPDERGSSVFIGERPRTDGNLAMAPDWRGEVSERLQQYRKRQRRLREGPAQPELAFGQEARAQSDEPVLSQAVHATTAVAEPLPEIAEPAATSPRWRFTEDAAATLRRPGRAMARNRSLRASGKRPRRARGNRSAPAFP